MTFTSEASGFAELGPRPLPNSGLPGGRCRCGHVSAPRPSLGCVVCGRTGDDVAPVVLAGRGRVLGHAVVHRHADAHPATPFTVLTVELDEGPVIRALLHPAVDEHLAVGDEVVSVVLDLPGRDGQVGPQLRFTSRRAG